MIYFTLPNFFYYREINGYLKQLLLKYPSYFKYDMKIIGEEGSFPFHYLNGNGLNTTYPYFYKKFCDYYAISGENEKHNFDSIILDYSNVNLNEKDLNDTVTNITLPLMQNGANKVLVSKKIFKDYIKINFPSYEIIGSEFYDGEDIEDLKRIRYFYFNINEDILKNKVEIILTIPCNCSNYFKCKILNQKKQYNYQKNSIFDDCNKNDLKKYVYNEEILNFLIKSGYKYFCFDLNNFSLNNCEEILFFYINTFIKKEYHDFAHLFLRGFQK